METMEEILPCWADDVNCAITVSDADCVIIYMNRRSVETFGDRVGMNMLECHSEHSVGIIRRLLAEGGMNCYTIEKRGVRKMIYQTAWRKDGKVAGLVEISMVIPADMPHYVRE